MAFTVQCTLIRKGGSLIDLGANVYHFAPNADGDHVAEVEDTDDLATLLGIKESFRIYRPNVPVTPEPAPAKPGA